MRSSVIAACVVVAVVLAGCGSSTSTRSSASSTHPTTRSTSTTHPSATSSTAAKATTSSTAAPAGSTTAPVGSTTTTAAALPGAPPCDPNAPGGNAPGIRPTLLFVGCATSADNVSSITWTAWTATSATGTATHAVNNCTPNCADGTFTKSPVDVQLSDPGTVNGMLVFRTLTITPTTSVGQPETVSVPSGSWGWVAS